jgi:hypothetical protein
MNRSGAETRENRKIVIPAKAGIHGADRACVDMDPRFRGDDIPVSSSVPL